MNTEIITLECCYDNPSVKIKAISDQNRLIEEFIRLEAPIRWALSTLKTKDDEVRYHESATNAQRGEEELIYIDNITQVIERYVSQGYIAQREEIARFINEVDSIFNQVTNHKPVKCTLILVKDKTPTT